MLLEENGLLTILHIAGFTCVACSVAAVEARNVEERLCYTLGTVFNPYPMYGVARILWNAIHQIDVDEEMHSRKRNSV